MAILNERDTKLVAERLGKLPRPVTLVVFTQEFECSYCRETRELTQELASISGGKLAVDVQDLAADKARADALGVDKIPAIALLAADGTDHGIRFFGIPAGYEFVSLLNAIELVAKGDSGLAPATRQKLKALDRPFGLQVFVTPTCPYCPRAVTLAFQMAMESPSITAAMVEATEFPHLANRYQVSGVPHTVIGTSQQPMVGALPEAAAVELVLAATRAPG